MEPDYRNKFLRDRKATLKDDILAVLGGVAIVVEIIIFVALIK